jgi:hypothetical protein
MNFVTLDSEIDRVERVLTLAREGGFADIVAAIQREIVEEILSLAAALAVMADGEDAREADRRIARLRWMAKARPRTRNTVTHVTTAALLRVCPARRRSRATSSPPAVARPPAPARPRWHGLRA